jgi:hypothetical protein
VSKADFGTGGMNLRVLLPEVLLVDQCALHKTYRFQISRKSVYPVRIIGLQVNFWQLYNSTDTTLRGLKSDINKGNLTDESVSLLFSISCRGPNRKHSKILLHLLHTLASMYGIRGCFLTYIVISRVRPCYVSSPCHQP